jgi:hypothetical protein
LVTITNAAGALLQQVQAGQGGPGILRAEADAGDLVIGTSAPQAADEVLFHAGQPVLRLSPAAAAALAGCTIGVRDTAEGPSLAIIGPNGTAPAPDADAPEGA